MAYAPAWSNKSSEPSEGFITDDDDEGEYENELDNGDYNPYDYNDGIPPYEGAMWDDEFGNWASNPMDPDIYDDEGNYKVVPDDEMPLSFAPTIPYSGPKASVNLEKEALKKQRDRLRERMRIAKAQVTAPAPTPAPAPAPAPAPNDILVAQANQGLPAGWTAQWSKTHSAMYYFNSINGNNQWVRPVSGGKKKKRYNTRKKSKRVGPRTRIRRKSNKMDRLKRLRLLTARKNTLRRRKRVTTRRK
jgi:hypothetical protein